MNINMEYNNIYNNMEYNNMEFAILKNDIES